MAELYDLAQDPAEKGNLAVAQSELVRRLARLLPAESELGRARRPDSTPEEVARLRSLGYISGSAAVKARYSVDDDPKNLVSIDRQLHQCVDLYQRGKLAEAIALGRTVLRERPGMEAGYENLGFLLRRADRTDEALRVYREAVERGVAGEELRSHYALALSESGRAEEAVAVLRPLASSTDPETLNALGIVLSDAGRGAEAAKTFDRALAEDPGFVEAVQNQGIVRLRAEDLAGARDLFRRALAQDDKLPRAWNGLGVALARLGDERGAIEAWDRAVDLDPGPLRRALQPGLDRREERNAQGSPGGARAVRGHGSRRCVPVRHRAGARPAESAGGPALVRSRAAVVALAMLAAACSRPAASSAKPGAPVVLISVDTLRADHLPAYGYGGVRTPALDALARDSIVFENAYCQAPLTLPSHATLLTGLLPSQHGVRDNVGFRLAGTHPTLATALKARGYATGAAVSSFALRRDRGLAAGFDLYDDQFGADSPDERPGAETVKRLESFADSNPGKPLFLFLHLYEPHTPYLAAEPFRTEYASRPYDGEVAASDAAVGGFLAHLKKSGLYNRAIIVFASDHGEGLGDHGEDEHGVFLYRETIRVPLFVKFPGSRGAGSRVRAPVGLIDVFPTIAETAGVPDDGGRPGLSLSRLAGPSAPATRRIYSETLYPRLQLGWSDLAALTDDRFSYIEAPRPELYDLVADPAQKNDLAESRPPALRSMRAELLTLRDSVASPEKSAAEELEKLGSLGYIRVDPGSAGKRDLPDPKDRVAELRDYKRLFDLFYAKRNDEAIALARRMLSANPQILSVSRILATSLERKGRPAEAAGVLEAALSRSDRTGSAEDVVQSAEELATLLSRSADPARAEKTLSDLVKRGVAGEPVRRELARLLHRRGRPAEALAVLPGAGTSADSATLDVYGAVLADSGRLDEARRAFTRALEIEPGRADVLLHLGMLSLRQKDPAGARDWFSKSLAADPAAPTTLAALGLAQAQLGDTRAALESWDRALVLDPRQYDTLFNRAVLAGRTGDAAAARRGLQQFIATAPAGRYEGQIAEARRLLRAMAGGQS